MTAHHQLPHKERFQMSRQEEGIIFFGRNPGDVLSAFHASGLAEQGFTINGRIIRQQAAVFVTSDANTDLLNGETLYAGTFTRQIMES